MQPAETFTIHTFIKLAILFVLLIAGVFVKVPDLTPTAGTGQANVSSPSSVLEPDSQRVKGLYFLIVNQGASAAAL